MAQCLSCGGLPAVDGHLVCWRCAGLGDPLDEAADRTVEERLSYSEMDQYARPAEWLNDGASKWALSAQAARHLDEDREVAAQDEKAGWLTEEALLAAGTIRKEDLTDLVRSGIIETVAEGPTRLYRLAKIK